MDFEEGELEVINLLFTVHAVLHWEDRSRSSSVSLYFTGFMDPSAISGIGTDHFLTPPWHV